MAPVARVGLREVAEHAGVSVATVSNVLNGTGRFSEAARERVNRSIDELGFVRNRAAVELRTARSVMIGLSIPDLTNPFFSRVTQQIIAEARERELLVVVMDAGGDTEAQRDQLNELRRQGVDSHVIVPVASSASLLATWAPGSGSATVFIDATTPSMYCSVAVDDFAGGRIAANHLLEAGARRLAFIAPQRGSAAIERRFAGAAEATRSFDAELEWVPTEGETADDGLMAAALVSARPAPPDAFFCANDQVAIGVQRSTHRPGSPLHSARVIGYDDTERTDELTLPLSSVRQPLKALGMSALDLLDAEINGTHHAHRRVLLQPELVARVDDRTSP